MPVPHLLLAILAACLTVQLVRPTSGEVIWQSSRNSQAAYAGFELPASEHWVGNSASVDFTPSQPFTGGGGSDFLILSSNFGNTVPPTDPRPISLSESENRNVVNTNAAFSTLTDPMHAEDIVGVGSSDGSTRPRPSSFSHYADVTNLDGLLLTQGQAHAVQDVDVNEDRFATSGKVWSSTYNRDDLPFGQSYADATSRFSATYNVTTEMEFIFKSQLSSLSDDVQVVMEFTGLESQISSRGDSHFFELCGTLTPGQYTLTISARSNAVKSSPLDDFVTPPADGGYGEYNMEFYAFESPHSSASIAHIPEPTASNMCIFGIAAFLVRCTRYKRRLA